MKTGFYDLDNVLQLNKGDLIVIASRPAMGKTTFLLNILDHITLEENKSILFFSLEDGKEKILNRLKIYNFNFLKRAPIYIKSDAPYSIDDICMEAKKIKEEKQIEAIIIDYLQLIQFNKNRLLSRDNEINEILKNIKGLAKILDIPIIITSQLSRECEKRDDKKPIIDDFSNSKKAITTYSDKILFLYRDSYYNKENKSDITDVIIAKNNDGTTGTIKVKMMP